MVTSVNPAPKPNKKIRGYITVSKQDFWAWKLKYTFFVMVLYLAIFTYVFEALNLEISIAEIQLPGNDNLAPAAVFVISISFCRVLESTKFKCFISTTVDTM
jgi:hypothetical protein